MSDPKAISCEEALRVLAAFLDDELHADARESLERHLEVCRSCFSRAEFERRLKEEISRLGRDEIPPSFEQRVRGILGSFGALPTGDRADGSPI
jgi:anti-sigma factor (TIGR02949 family)